jgi:hypothetical protein
MSFPVGLHLPGVGVPVPASGSGSGAIPLPGLLRLAEEADASALTLLVLDGLGTATPAGAPGTGAGDLDALDVLAHLAAGTRRIGLVAHTPGALVEPFHVATRTATLDHLSAGRAGWYPAPTPLVEEAGECLAAVRLLWDSWEDAARIRDVASGRFLDGDRIHHVDFVGRHLTVRGPSVTPRPPQGHPVVFGPDDTADVRVGGEPTTERPVFVQVPLDGGAPAAVRRAREAGYAGVLLRTASGAGWADRFAQALAVAAEHGAPAGDTLRERLGLPRPANVFTKDAS